MGVFLLLMAIVLAAGFVIVAAIGFKSDRATALRQAALGRYVQDVTAAAARIHDFLARVDADAHAGHVLDNVDLGDGFSAQVADALHSISPFAQWKLTFFAGQDLIRCYRKLGHYLSDSDTPEMLGLLIAMSRILRFGKGELATDWHNPAWRQRVGPSLAAAVRQFDGSVKTSGHEDELLFCTVFGRDVASPDVARQYAVLLYRWASLVAKADGKITPRESEWLAKIMRQGAPSAARPPDAISAFRAIELPPAPTKALDALTGLAPVKAQVRKLAQLIAINAERRKRGMKVAPLSYHCVFTGNPGTGKTTVARILADVYRDLGVLAKGHLVETDRSGLVAEYVGQTAVKTNKVIDAALDGMLFVDEAYTLVGGGKEDFGREAIATLLKRMEDDRDRLVVVLAGYTGEMGQFIASNPGLKSRFGRFVEFPDYSVDELMEIFLKFAKENQYVCTSGAKRALRRRLEHEVASQDKSFGNARFARNLFERAIEHQAQRLAGVAPLTPEILEQLATEDMEAC